MLVALAVTGIITGAVATMAYAFSTAEEDGRGRSMEQAQLRYTVLRLGELLRNARLICGYNDGDLVVWVNDDNEDSDDYEENDINVNELVIIERGGDSEYLRLRKFDTFDNPRVTLSQTTSLDRESYRNNVIELKPLCRNVQFDLHGQDPPYTQRVSLAWEAPDGGGWRSYRISANLRGWSGHLLSEDGNEIVPEQD